MNVTFDTKDFDRTFREYLKVNKRASVELINKKATQLAAVALNKTPFAGNTRTRAQAERHIYRELKNPRNDGNDRGHKRWSNLGEAIIQQAKFKREGKYYPEGQLQTEAAQLINARKRKIGFLRAGWLPALRTLNRQAIKNRYVHADYIDRLGQREQREAKKVSAGKDKGYAIPAYGLRMRATIANSVNVGLPQRAEALRKALEYVRRDMLQYIARKHKQVLDKFQR